MPSAAAIGAAGALLGGAGQAVSAVTGGGPTERTRVPPALENVQIGLIESQIKDFENDRKKAEATGLAIQNRTNLLDRVSRGLIPKEEAVKAITAQNEQIAKTFGTEVLNEVSRLTKGPESIAGLQQEIQRQTSNLVRNPEAIPQDSAIGRQIAQGRAQLQEQLQRQLGPGYAQTEAGIRALRAFDDNVPQAQAQRLQGLSSLVGQQSEQGQSFGNFLRSGQQGAQQALAQGFQLGTQGFGAAEDLRKDNAQLSQIPFSTIQSFGAQSLSGDTRNALALGGYGKTFSQFAPKDANVDPKLLQQQQGGNQNIPYGGILGLNPDGTYRRA